MKRISFNTRFVNKAGNDLVPGKIHTIRQNYHFWKRFEGRDAALFTWEGKPYRSRQNVFCIKKIVSVKAVTFDPIGGFWIPHLGGSYYAPLEQMAYNDGFDSIHDFLSWFGDKPLIMAVLHFTDFLY